MFVLLLLLLRSFCQYLACVSRVFSKASFYIIRIHTFRTEQDVLIAKLGQPEMILDLALTQFGCYVARALLRDERGECNSGHATHFGESIELGRNSSWSTLPGGCRGDSTVSSWIHEWHLNRISISETKIPVVALRIQSEKSCLGRFFLKHIDKASIWVAPWSTTGVIMRSFYGDSVGQLDSVSWIIEWTTYLNHF